jgi:hypothetical protein
MWSGNRSALKERQQPGLLLLIILVLISVSRPAHAELSDAVVRVSYTDTLYCTPKSSILSNNISLTNLTDQPLSITVLSTASKGWKCLSAKATFTIPAQSKKVLPVSSIKQANQLAAVWSDVEILVVSADKKSALRYKYHIKNSLVTKYSIRNSGASEIYYFNKNEKKEIKFTLRNDGGQPINYKVKWGLSTYGASDQKTLQLQAHQDTVITYTIRLDESIIKRLKNDVFQVSIVDDSNNAQKINYNLWYTAQTSTEHKSAYNYIPLKVEAGGYMRGEQRFAYLDLAADVDMGKQRMLSMSYRTQEYTTLNYNQKDVFQVYYDSKHWRAYVGQAQKITDFRVAGNEASLTAKFGKKSAASVWVMQPYEATRANNSHEQTGASLHYTIGKVSLEHQFAATVDSNHNLDAAILFNRLNILSRKYARIGLSYGIGFDSLNYYGLQNRINTDAGSSYGLNFSSSYKAFTLSANIFQSTANYPGLNRGSQRRDGSLGIKVSRLLSFAPYYTSSVITNNYSVDTLLNTNRLDYNMQRYGLRTTISTKKLNLSVSAGYYKNTSSSNLPRFQYADLGLSYRNDKSLMLVVNSQNGLAENSEGRNNVWFNSTLISVSSKWVQLMGSYFRFPNESSDDTIAARSSMENMYLSLGYPINLLNRISGHVSYEVALYSMNSVITHNISANINFRLPDNSFYVRVMGSIPVYNVSSDNAGNLFNRNYIQLTLGKTFNVPVITRKKYYDLNLKLYYDQNSNNIKDDSEQVLEKAFVRVDQRLFVTGKRGSICLNNLDPGPYSIDYSKAQVSNGFIPSQGYTETINLSRDTVVDVPFKKGKIITGTVNFVLDSLSNLRPKMDGIKVIIKENNSVIGYTMTDNTGAFSITIPSGIYSVSLNPDAFNDKFKPVQLSFNVDVTKVERESVQFTVIQKKREMRILKR